MHYTDGCTRGALPRMPPNDLRLTPQPEQLVHSSLLDITIAKDSSRPTQTQLKNAVLVFSMQAQTALNAPCPPPFGLVLANPPHHPCLAVQAAAFTVQHRHKPLQLLRFRSYYQSSPISRLTHSPCRSKPQPHILSYANADGHGLSFNAD